MCFFLEDIIISDHQLLEKRWYPNLLNVHGVQSPNECFTAILAYQCWYISIGFWYWFWCFVAKASTMKSLKSFRYSMDRLEKKTILKKRWQNHKKTLRVRISWAVVLHSCSSTRVFSSFSCCPFRHTATFSSCDFMLFFSCTICKFGHVGWSAYNRCLSLINEKLKGAKFMLHECSWYSIMTRCIRHNSEPTFL